MSSRKQTNILTITATYKLKIKEGGEKTTGINLGFILRKFILVQVFQYEEHGFYKNIFDKSRKSYFVVQSKYTSILLHLHTIYFPVVEIIAILIA